MYVYVVVHFVMKYPSTSTLNVAILFAMTLVVAKHNTPCLYTITITMYAAQNGFPFYKLQITRNNKKTNSFDLFPHFH